MMKYFESLLLRDNIDNFPQSDIRKTVKLLAECQEELEKDNYVQTDKKFNECNHLYKKLVAKDPIP